MNPDGTEDKNLLVFAAPFHSRTVEDHRGQTLQADSSHTGIIKATAGVEHFTVLADEVIGAKETAVDAHRRASFCRFIAKVWDVSACKYGFSNKAGCIDNYFEGVVRGRAKECEFFQDNWSDYNHDPSTSVLNLRPEDGKTPIRVRYLYHKPKFIDGSGPYVFIFPQPWIPLPRSWLALTYNQLRRWGFFR